MKDMVSRSLTGSTACLPDRSSVIDVDLTLHERKAETDRGHEREKSRTVSSRSNDDGDGASMQK